MQVGVLHPLMQVGVLSNNQRIANSIDTDEMARNKSFYLLCLKKYLFGSTRLKVLNIEAQKIKMHWAQLFKTNNVVSLHIVKILY